MATQHIANLRVHPEQGAGIEVSFVPHRGYVLEAISNLPGQPGLQTGDVIVAVGGISTALALEEDADEVLASGLADGVALTVEREAPAGGLVTCLGRRSDAAPAGPVAVLEMPQLPEQKPAEGSAGSAEAGPVVSDAGDAQEQLAAPAAPSSDGAKVDPASAEATVSLGATSSPQQRRKEPAQPQSHGLSTTQDWLGHSTGEELGGTSTSRQASSTLTRTTEELPPSKAPAQKNVNDASNVLEGKSPPNSSMAPKGGDSAAVPDSKGAAETYPDKASQKAMACGQPSDSTVLAFMTPTGPSTEGLTREVGASESEVLRSGPPEELPQTSSCNQPADSHEEHLDDWGSEDVHGSAETEDEVVTLPAGAWAGEEAMPLPHFLKARSEEEPRPPAMPVPQGLLPLQIVDSGGSSCSSGVLLQGCKVASLSAWLEELSLAEYLGAATRWCTEMGAVSLEEIADNIEDFGEAVSLKPIERQRVRKWASQVASTSSAPQFSAPPAAPSYPNTRIEARSSSSRSFEQPEAASSPVYTARSVRLAMDSAGNTGMDLRWDEEWGVRVEHVDPLPGQPGLSEGDYILAIDGCSLRHRSHEECDGIFAHRLRNGAVLSVVKQAAAGHQAQEPFQGPRRAQVGGKGRPQRHNALPRPPLRPQGGGRGGGYDAHRMWSRFSRPLW